MCIWYLFTFIYLIKHSIVNLDLFICILQFHSLFSVSMETSAGITIENKAIKQFFKDINDLCEEFQGLYSIQKKSKYWHLSCKRWENSGKLNVRGLLLVFLFRFQSFLCFVFLQFYTFFLWQCYLMAEC